MVPAPGSLLTSLPCWNQKLLFLKYVCLEQVIGGLVEGAKFPSRQVFEQVKQGSSEVIMEVSYLSDELRVTRNENGQVFVFGKVSAGVSDTGFN